MCACSVYIELLNECVHGVLERNSCDVWGRDRRLTGDIVGNELCYVMCINLNVIINKKSIWNLIARDGSHWTVAFSRAGRQACTS